MTDETSVAAPDGGSANEYEVRSARWRDLGEVFRTYRAQTEANRLFYHPFPFDRVRLALLLAGFVVTRPLVRRTVQWAPRESALLVVARDRSDGALAGFGSVNFRWADGQGLVARTGLYVSEAHRRRGIGGRLEQEMVRMARSLGARRAEALIREANVGSVGMYRSLGYRIGPSDIRDRKPPREMFLLAEKELP